MHHVPGTRLRAGYAVGYYNKNKNFKAKRTFIENMKNTILVKAEET